MNDGTRTIQSSVKISITCDYIMFGQVKFDGTYGTLIYILYSISVNIATSARLVNIFSLLQHGYICN